MDVVLRIIKMVSGFLVFWLPPVMFVIGFMFVVKLAVLAIAAQHPDPTPAILFLAGVIAIKEFK